MQDAKNRIAIPDAVRDDAEGDEVASTSIVEPMSWKLEFTMHVRGELKNPYLLEARLFYPDGPTAEPRQFSFDITPPPPPFDAAQGEPDSAE